MNQFLNAIDRIINNSANDNILACIIKQYNCQWLITTPTRETWHSASGIYNIIRNIDDELCYFQVLATAIADHYGIQLLLKAGYQLEKCNKIISKKD